MVAAFSVEQAPGPPCYFENCGRGDGMAYQPIEDYGVIGNLRTVALVGRNGSIDWLCFPHFDSPSGFGAILDDRRGGFFRVHPETDSPETDGVTCKQLYLPDTNILVTRFLSADGVAEVTDYMAIDAPQEDRGFHGLVRKVK